MPNSRRKRKYSMQHVKRIPTGLFTQNELAAFDDYSRRIYKKVTRRVNAIELAIEKALSEGKKINRGELRKTIRDNYGSEVFDAFAYTQENARGKRRTGDPAIMHAHATQARAARILDHKVQRLAMMHDVAEDNSHSIVDVEYHLWEQRAKYDFPKETVDSLRLLTNIYRMMLDNADERIRMRDRSYSRKLLLSMPHNGHEDIKMRVRDFLKQRRNRLDRKGLYFDETYMRDLETIVDLVNIKRLDNDDALEAIGHDSEIYSAKKLKARSLKSELESQQEFIDQSVERLLFERRYKFVLNTLNVSKYTCIVAKQDDWVTEKQGALLTILSGLEDAMNIIGDTAGYDVVRQPYNKTKRLTSRVIDDYCTIDDPDCVKALLAIAQDLDQRLGKDPYKKYKLVDISSLRKGKRMVQEQKKAETRLSFQRAMGKEFSILDQLLIKLADVGEQLITRNQLMYLNAFSPKLRNTPIKRITAADINEAKKKTVKRLRERYQPYFSTLNEIIKNCYARKGMGFFDAVAMKAYDRYIQDMVEAEKNAYISYKASESEDPYRGPLLVKIYDAIDNIRGSALADMRSLPRLIEKTLIIERAARSLEDFYAIQCAEKDVIGAIRGSRLVLIDMLHMRLISNAQRLAKDEDNQYRNVMVPFLLEGAKMLYENKQKYFGRAIKT
jgi:hypothetical protein